ncbi:fungal-specific transcription factor domain-containing protein [Aspergillus nidulans var. acristatus]
MVVAYSCGLRQLGRIGPVLYGRAGPFFPLNTQADNSIAPPTMTDSPRTTCKRLRPSYNCTECRRRKVKCDRSRPSCGQCRALGLTSACLYEDNPRRFTLNRDSSRNNHNSEGQDGQSRMTGEDVPAGSGGIHGAISKTRVFGHGHWMNTFSVMEGLAWLEPIGDCFQAFSSLANGAPSNEAAETVFMCKRLAQMIKQQRPSRRCLPPDLYSSLPDRGVMDALVELYFATFESCYGILDYYTFMEEYRTSLASGESADRSFILLVLLIMTVAGPLHSNASVRSEVAASARIWIDIAQTWLSAPLEKDRLSLKAVQVHCLLALSRQVNQVGSDLVWISAGSLVRMAMQMGLHQDPDLLGQMDPRQKHIRRRLWYTIMELNVQAAIDSGMPPMVTDGDYTTRPPPDEMAGSEAATAAGQPSLQGVLARSLSVRLRATRVINSMQEEPSYDRVLELGGQLASACSEAARVLNQSACGSSAFTSSFCSHLLRRFTLCLHYRYAIRAKSNPLYSHSRHACLEAALDLVTLLEDSVYSQLLVTGGGMFRDLITRGALVIFLELAPDAEEDASIFAKRRNRARQEPLLRDVRRLVQYAKDRVLHGDMNVKTYVCLSMMLAQAEACLDDSPAKETVSKAMHESLATCRDILQTRADAVTAATTHSDLGLWTNGISPQDLDINLDSDFDGLFDFGFTGSDFSL